MTLASTLICFNGKLKNVTGTVVLQNQEFVIVDFENDGILYRGKWLISELTDWI